MSAGYVRSSFLQHGWPDPVADRMHKASLTTSDVGVRHIQGGFFLLPLALHDAERVA